ncbi:MAG: hypothetical protein EBQ84_03030 [Betaproteobacteria bacterium]|nr:hypothetical protein [Betaproteobacteria bacterium]
MPIGFLIQHASIEHQPHDHQQMMEQFELAGLVTMVEFDIAESTLTTQYRLKKIDFDRLTPDFDTIYMFEKLDQPLLNSQKILQREIIIALLASPMELIFPSLDEWMSAVRMRHFLVEAARQTSMNFRTESADRPTDYWDYSEETGFILKKNKSLIDALQMATQPSLSGYVYAFSCYRATEYIILLAIAQELKLTHPKKYQALEDRWQKKAISSRLFHDVFLQELGSLEKPLPITWYVPGDRVWFRNPDDVSSDVTGYEGSWIIYLGGGMFANFWQSHRPYTLEHKCIEVFHWRDGLQKNISGQLEINEEIVESRVDQTFADSTQRKNIFSRMFRLRDAQGVYESGGCMDATREWIKWVRPQTCNLDWPVDT